MLSVACGQEEVKPPPDQVTVQLKWVHQAQFAGFYMAQEKGYYAGENIEIAFLEGGPDLNILEQVVTGEADFGVGAPEDILVQRSQGEPLVTIAAIYRRNPTVFVALADSGIERPTDFLGRTVAVGGVVEFELQLKAMFARLGLDLQQTRIVPHSYDLAQLYNGEVDTIAVYSTGGLIRARRAGYDLNLIWPGNYGIHFYADTLFTTNQLIEENPGLVTRFLRATLQGWREAIEDPEAAVASTLKVSREPDAELQTQMMEASIPLIHTGQGHIGWMQAEVWQGMHDILLEQGILNKPLDLYQVYTMKFLHQVYGE
jgi:NitT/TauT family transport system substrate-binding protein